MCTLFGDPECFEVLPCIPKTVLELLGILGRVLFRNNNDLKAGCHTRRRVTLGADKHTILGAGLVLCGVKQRQRKGPFVLCCPNLVGEIWGQRFDVNNKCPTGLHTATQLVSACFQMLVKLDFGAPKGENKGRCIHMKGTVPCRFERGKGKFGTFLS